MHLRGSARLDVPTTPLPRAISLPVRAGYGCGALLSVCADMAAARCCEWIQRAQRVVNGKAPAKASRTMVLGLATSSPSDDTAAMKRSSTGMTSASYAATPSPPPPPAGAVMLQPATARLAAGCVAGGPGAGAALAARGAAGAMLSAGWPLSRDCEAQILRPSRCSTSIKLDGVHGEILQTGGRRHDS
jgi:hypothetical protein